MKKVRTRTLRFISIILLIIYFGAIEREDLFNEVVRLYILFVFLAISSVVPVVLFLRKELKKRKSA